MKEITSKILNNKLIAKQNLSQQQVDSLENLHREMIKLKKMKLKDIKNIEDYVFNVESLEYKMQHEWGFPQNSDYHVHWFQCDECKCGYMDNMDMVGTKYRTISGDCPLHNIK